MKREYKIVRKITEEEIDKLHASYTEANPYKHSVIQNLCDPEKLRRVRDEIIENFDATYKETDLFKMFQTVDMANLDSLDEEKKKKIPTLLSLRDDIYSTEFRELMSRVTGCGELSDVTDCACNIHSKGGHLLCHDDVIGDRRVSYIIYLTDPDVPWAAEDGGALELYPEDDTKPLVPYAIPSARTLPTWNSMAFFKVQAGKSFHSIQEVMTQEKPRMSIQGWFHGTSADEHPEAVPTLQMLQAKMQAEDLQRYQDFKSTTHEPDGGQRIDANDYTLSENDIAYLSAWINPIYLSGKGMPKIQAKFEEDGSVQLLNFLNSEVSERIKAAIKEADAAAGMGSGRIPDDTVGMVGGWELHGPPHMQRYLQFNPRSFKAGQSCPENTVGVIMQEIYDQLISSRPFCNLIRSFTTLTMIGCQGEVRRFRPGLDYTVAHYGGLTKDPRMDAVLCFVDEEKMDWGDGECGGFEAYLLADEEEDGPAEVYRQVQDDDTGVLNVSPAFNSLNLVLRDEGLMRFIKFLSASAAGSRWDISAILLPENDSDEEN